jgi:hypothetical protein
VVGDNLLAVPVDERKPNPAGDARK